MHAILLAEADRPASPAVCNAGEYHLMVQRFDYLWSLPSSPVHQAEMQQLIDHINRYDEALAQATRLAAV